MKSLEDAAQRRKHIVALERILGEMPQAELKMEHHYIDGAYLRVMHMPKHCLLIGRVHKFACINIILSGRARVATVAGDTVITGPHIFTSPAGTKRAIYALSDTIWATVHDLPDGVERTGDAMAEWLTVPS